MAKQKSSDARRASPEERGVPKYAAVTRRRSATQQLATFCDAIKKMIARHPCGTQRGSLPLLPPGPDGVREPSLRRTRLSNLGPVRMGRSLSPIPGCHQTLAERGGFEPPVRCRTHDFQSCTFGLSVTSPKFSFNRKRSDLRGSLPPFDQSLRRAARQAASAAARHFTIKYRSFKEQINKLPKKNSNGGEGGIRTHGPGHPEQTISSRPRYDHFGTSPLGNFHSRRISFVISLFAYISTAHRLLPRICGTCESFQNERLRPPLRDRFCPHSWWL
jgi:hypothetical protein